MMETPTPKNPMLRVMSLHDFRLLFAGATTSLLGDQFALIATPWLTLQPTVSRRASSCSSRMSSALY